MHSLLLTGDGARGVRQFDFTEGSQLLTVLCRAAWLHMLMFALINTFLDDRGDGGSLKVEENDWSVGLTEAGARIIPQWSGPFPQPTGVTVQLIKLEVMLQTLRGCTASAAGGGSHHCLMRCWRCCNGCQTCQAFRAGGMAKGDSLDYALMCCKSER